MTDPLNTRDRILNSAEELFFQQGIAVTGVDRVAATAGVAIVTLYKHFGSKDNLLREVLARRLETWTKHWDEAIARAATAEDRLLAVFDAIETFRASANQTQWCSFLATASERPAPTGDQDDPVFELIRQDTQMITERLTRLAKEASCPEPATVSAVLLLLYNGVLSSRLRGEPSNPVAHARTVGRSIMRAGVGQPHAVRS
ncbi:MAG: TetR/AcrR family transcriptional regulator [Actinomycetota bacterium]